jgi:hypothetical protein
MATSKAHPKPSTSLIQPLRALTTLLTTTPADQLPIILCNVQSYISPILPLLRTPAAPNTETSTLLHSLRTRTTSLLTDRSPLAKLAAIILIKSLLEAAPTEFLSSSGTAWIKNLISIVGRTDGVCTTTRGLALQVATRLLVLAKDEGDTLAREIATPNVPLLLDAALGVVIGEKNHWAIRKVDMLPFVLESLVTLVPRHTATVRPFIGRIIILVGKIVDVPGEEKKSEEKYAAGPEVKDLARKVYVLLHDCATKTGSLPERNAGFKIALELVTRETEECFSALLDSDRLDFTKRPSSAETFPPISQVVESLAFLKAYVTTASSKPISISIGSIIQLIQLLSAASPSIPPPDLLEMSKRERERYLLDLPNLHIAALDFAFEIINQLGTSALPVSFTILDSIINIYSANKTSSPVKTSIYNTLTTLLPLIGPSLTLNQNKPLLPLIHTLTSDILPIPSAPVPTAASLTATTSISTKHPTLSLSTSLQNTPLSTAASNLLPHLLALPAASLPPSARAVLDRTAILSQNAPALVASSLNPQFVRGTSLLPLAMRCVDAREGLEGVVRPRVLGSSLRPVNEVEAEAEEEEEEDVDVVSNVDSEEAQEEEEDMVVDESAVQEKEVGENGDVHMDELASPSIGKHILEEEEDEEEEELRFPTKKAKLGHPPIVVPTITGQLAMEMDEDVEDEDEISDSEVQALVAGI